MNRVLIVGASRGIGLEIALMSPEPDTAKAEAYFERALCVALQQQAKSSELRALVAHTKVERSSVLNAGCARRTALGLAPSVRAKSMASD